MPRDGTGTNRFNAVGSSGSETEEAKRKRLLIQGDDPEADRMKKFPKPDDDPDNNGQGNAKGGNMSRPIQTPSTSTTALRSPTLSEEGQNSNYTIQAQSYYKKMM